MEWQEKWRKRRCGLTVVFICIGFSAAFGVDVSDAKGTAHAAQTAAERAVGTIETITGNSIVLTTDARSETTIHVPDGARLLRVEPGAKDLKDAVPLQLKELQPGDRILVRGKLAEDGKTLEAASVIAMKHEDIAAKQAHERDEWQKHGVGGLVSVVDPSAGTIKISTNATGVAKEVTVQASKQTVLRRYAPSSVKFDDAKPAPIGEIKVGDQLRARGTRNADGTEMTADEIVSGTFRNIAGTIETVDATGGTITVMDLVAKRPVIVKVGPETQIRKLPAMIAQGIAMRLKGASSEESAAGNGSAGSTQKPAVAPAENAARGQSGGRPGGSEGMGRSGGGRGADLQQVLSRVPAETLADLHKGDAVMIVTTEGTQESAGTAITLLAGVEPILEASPKGGASSILTPWTMSAAPSGDTTP